MAHRLLLLLVLLLAFPVTLTALPPQEQPEQIAQLVRDVKLKGDEADPALLEQLAAIGTRQAMDALIELQAGFSSIYMRREVVRALGRFTKVEGCQQKSLETIANAATTSKEPEIREVALDLLAAEPQAGKPFLRMIIESPADDVVRIEAMQRHVKIATAEDQAWYLELLEAPTKQAKPKKPAKGAEQELQVHSLADVRTLAFEQLASTMEVTKLMQYARDKEKDANDYRRERVRRLALLELEKRKDKRAKKVAQDAYDDSTELAENRAVAARILANLEGDKMLNSFLDDGGKDPSVVPLELRATLAELVATMLDAGAERKLLKALESRKSHERLFALRALQGAAANPKLDEALLEQLTADEDDVKIAACKTIAARKLSSAVPALAVLVQNVTRPDVAAAAIDTLAELRAQDPTWNDELATLAVSNQREIRNAALAHLAAREHPRRFELLQKSIEHPDWSTRCVALRGLENLRTHEATALIIARMPAEEGLILQRFADALWRLTGQPFRLSARTWSEWWAKEGKSAPLVSAEELARLQEDEESRRLKASTRVATFFGIRIVSHRVIFILDISGSMTAMLRGHYVGEKGEERITVAKRELIKAIEGLDKTALFDIVVFESGVSRWRQNGLAGGVESERKEAVEFVGRLAASGGTNLFGALKEAFNEKEVDMIVVLSDGEPSVGEIIDPVGIREAVRAWNKHRGIVIHTVAVGAHFRILEWLAADTGGKHVQFD